MAALCDLARHYRLPVFSFGGCSDSKSFDQQASLEAALWILTTALAGGNLSHDVGYIEYGLTASMEMTVMNDEIIGLVRRILGGVEVSEETMAVDVIDKVGPGGHFLDARPHTPPLPRELVPRLCSTAPATPPGRRRVASPTARWPTAACAKILESTGREPLPGDVQAAVSAIAARADTRCGIGKKEGK